MDLSRTRNCAPVAATSRRNSAASKPRSANTSIVWSRWCSSWRAQAISPSRPAYRSRAEQRAGAGLAPGSSAGSPGSRSPRAAFSLPSQPRFPAVSGTLIDRQPSKATVRYRPNITPGVRGRPSGPANTSNSARSGAGPSRRRRSRSARDEGTARPSPSSAAVSFAHTPRYPAAGNNHSASTKYSPTREGSSRSRRCGRARDRPAPHRPTRTARPGSAPPDARARTPPPPP